MSENNNSNMTGKNLFIQALSSKKSDENFLKTFMSTFEVDAYKRLFQKIQKNNRVPSKILKVLLTRSDLNNENLRRTILRTRSLLPRNTDERGFVSFCSLFKCVSYVQSGGDISKVNSLKVLREMRPCLARIRGVTTEEDSEKSTKKFGDREQILQLRSSSKLKAMFGIDNETEKMRSKTKTQSPQKQLQGSPKLQKMFGQTKAEKTQTQSPQKQLAGSAKLQKMFGKSRRPLAVRLGTLERQSVLTPPSESETVENKKATNTARTISEYAKAHFDIDDTSTYRRMLRNVDDQDFAATEWISFKNCIPNPEIRNEYKSRIRDEFTSDSFIEGLMSEVVGVHTNFDKIFFEQYSRKKKAIFVFGPSAAGKSFGIKSNLKTLLRVANWPTELLFHTIDGGQMRESSSLWAEMKLNRLAVIRNKLFGDMENEDDQDYESKTDFRGFTDLYSRYFKKYIHKVKDRMFDMLLARGSNVIIPDTATSLLKDRTICKIKALAKEGYEIFFSAVVASKAKCEHNGFSRELSEGKKYSSFGWSRAMGKVPQILNKLRVNGICSNLPAVILDNNDWNKGTGVKVVEPWHLASYNASVLNSWSDTDHMMFHKQPSLEIETRPLKNESGMTFAKYFKSIHEDMISTYSSHEIRGSSASMRRFGGLMGLEHPGTSKMGTLIWDTFNAWLVKYEKNSSSPTKKKSSQSMLSRFKRSLSSKGSLRNISKDNGNSHLGPCAGAICFKVKTCRVFLVDTVSLKRISGMITGLSSSTIEHILDGASLLVLDKSTIGDDLELPKEQKDVPSVLRGETLRAIFSDYKTSWYLLRAVDHPAQIRWFFAINHTLKRDPVQIPRPRSLSSELIVPKAPMPMAPPKDRRPKNLSTLSIRGSFDEAEISKRSVLSVRHGNRRRRKGEKSKWKIIEEDKETEEEEEEEKKKRSSIANTIISPIRIEIAPTISNRSKHEEEEEDTDDESDGEDYEHEEMADQDDEEDALRELARLSPGLHSPQKSPRNSGGSSKISVGGGGVMRKKIVFAI